LLPPLSTCPLVFTRLYMLHPHNESVPGLAIWSACCRCELAFPLLETIDTTVGFTICKYNRMFDVFSLNIGINLFKYWKQVQLKYITRYLVEPII
jgi:hypothetical protein